MAGLQVEVVPRAVEVGGHGRDKVGAVLPIVALAHENAADLCDGIGVVGQLQLASEQVCLRHGLGCELGIDARAAEKEEFFNAKSIGRIDEVGLNLEIDADKISRKGVIGLDPTDLGRCDKYVFRAHCVKKPVCCPGICQVKILNITGYDTDVPTS